MGYITLYHHAINAITIDPHSFWFPGALPSHPYRIVFSCQVDHREISGFALGFTIYLLTDHSLIASANG